MQLTYNFFTVQHWFLVQDRTHPPPSPFFSLFLPFCLLLECIWVSGWSWSCMATQLGSILKKRHNVLRVHQCRTFFVTKSWCLGFSTLAYVIQIFCSSKFYEQWNSTYWAMPFIYNLLLKVQSLLLYLISNFQICECPVLFARLEVLNLSGNRLTDACGSYLSTILEKCKGKTLPLQTS